MFFAADSLSVSVTEASGQRSLKFSDRSGPGTDEGILSAKNPPLSGAGSRVTAPAVSQIDFKRRGMHC